jgi:16S rRNA (guanine527-N7)-methyltransferase
MSSARALSPENRKKLLDALGDAQRIGMLGNRPLEQVIDHSMGFAEALNGKVSTVIDLGSGGGDPGLVIALACPDIQVTLVDRRSKRTDLLVRLVGRLGIQAQVEVIEADVADLPIRFAGRTWGAVTSRGFGSPTYTAQHAGPLLLPGGLFAVSEPPDGDGSRWIDPTVAMHGLSLQEVRFGVALLVKA